MLSVCKTLPATTMYTSQNQMKWYYARRPAATGAARICELNFSLQPNAGR